MLIARQFLGNRERPEVDKITGLVLLFLLTRKQLTETRGQQLVL